MATGSRPRFIDVEAEAAAGVDCDVDRSVSQPALNAVLKQQGVRALRPVQALAIQHGLFFRRSMLVFSPSGSGKTLIGELAAANTVLEGYGKAAYLVPLKALATEKYKHFVRYLAPLGVRVEISIGDYDLPPEDIDAADIIVMTYEKLDSIMRSGPGAVRGRFACMVVDEVHVLGERGRGPRLESLLIRASRAMAGVQLVALSATVANPRALNDWLSSLGHDSLLVTSRERPVPLHHEVVLARDNVATIQAIAREVAGAGGQVLVFARTRKNAEELARRLASCGGAPGGSLNVPKATYEARKALAFRIQRSARRSALPPLVLAGVAYHHAGLSPAERELVEAGFRDRVLGAICCTTTLSAGINMPARAVIIEDYKQRAIPDERIAVPGKFHKLSAGSPVSFDPMPRNVFHQIAGRAGRAG